MSVISSYRVLFVNGGMRCFNWYWIRFSPATNGLHLIYHCAEGQQGRPWLFAFGDGRKVPQSKVPEAQPKRGAHTQLFFFSRGNPNRPRRENLVNQKKFPISSVWGGGGSCLRRATRRSSANPWGLKNSALNPGSLIISRFISSCTADIITPGGGAERVSRYLPDDDKRTYLKRKQKKGITKQEIHKQILNKVIYICGTRNSDRN